MLTPTEVLNPIHTFRHPCAMNMLAAGALITDIKNRLGHENINSTMVYLKMEMCQKREVQKQFLTHTQSVLSQDSKMGELNSWENKDEILTWLGGCPRIGILAKIEEFSKNKRSHICDIASIIF